jgi:hypothetical protein
MKERRREKKGRGKTGRGKKDERKMRKVRKGWMIVIKVKRKDTRTS